jgi:hypothetical protein
VRDATHELRLETLRFALANGLYRPDPRTIATAVLIRALSRLGLTPFA